MKLYGTPPTRAIRVQWLLNELGIDCEVVGLDPLEPDAEFLALNPAGKLPVLVDGDVVVTESAAIPLYLAEKHPEKGLIPRGLEDRAQMYRWIFFLVTEIEQPLWRIALNTAIYPEEERVPADIKNATRDCKKMVAVFERHMADREFVVGDRLSVADFIAAYTLDWTNEDKMLADAPRLRSYLETMYARPTAPMTIAEGFAAIQSRNVKAAFEGWRLVCVARLPGEADLSVSKDCGGCHRPSISTSVKLTVSGWSRGKERGHQKGCSSRLTSSQFDLRDRHDAFPQHRRTAL